VHAFLGTSGATAKLSLAGIPACKTPSPRHLQKRSIALSYHDVRYFHGMFIIIIYLFYSVSLFLVYQHGVAEKCVPMEEVLFFRF